MIPEPMIPYRPLFRNWEEREEIANIGKALNEDFKRKFFNGIVARLNRETKTLTKMIKEYQ